MEFAWYVAAVGGIWSNWVADDFMGRPEVPGDNAFQMLSLGAGGHGQELTYEACEP